MRIVIIGNSKIANDCLKEILNQDAHELTGVLFEPSKNPAPGVLIQSIQENQLAHHTIDGNVNSPDCLHFIRSCEPDWIFNINCYQYLKNDLLAIPEHGVINFHNGPLPKYGGVNISSWPIILGENTHGVTWHMVNQGIDTGDILSQQNFEIPPRMTAAQLMVKSIEVGIQLFISDWQNWITGKVIAKPQEGLRTYFSKKDLAPNQGRLDWNMDAEILDRWIRGMHLFPYPNDFAYAHFTIEEQTYWVIASEFILDKPMGAPGTIIERNSKYCKVQCGVGALVLKMIALPHGKSIKWDEWYLQLEALGIEQFT